ncbi:hypothetical protein ACP70R_043247 [Stipagrostis hirtigluma subsp. patula]
MMATPWDSLAVQLLVCCTLMLVFAHPVASASRGLMSPAPAPTALAPTPAAHTAPALTPATPTSPVPAPGLVETTWNVEYILWSPDCKQHGMIGINGSFPGPTITAKAGDRIRVVVNNKLDTEGVVIHWHGMKQIGTPWADGTASISQCPINPGETFTYEFTADKPGTYFYHGHYGMQRAAGLYGSLIVDVPEGKTEPFKYDGELNLLLSDWYHEAVYAQAAGLERKDKHFRWIGEPQTLLINGKGQFDCTLGDVGEFHRLIRHDAKKCERMDGESVEMACDKDCGEDGSKVEAACREKECSSGGGKDKAACETECRKKGEAAAKVKAVCEEEKTVSCEKIRRSECGPFCRETQCGPAVFDVEPGKTYRIRIASTTSLSALNLQVQGHELTVVEADGNYVKPFTVDDIDIYSGESYSVLLKTKTAEQGPLSSYWISVGVRGRTPRTLPALAVLKYTGSNSGLPEGAPPETPDWADVARSKNFTYRILALERAADTPPTTVNRRIDMLNTQNVIDGHTKWAINHVSLSLPATPYLGAYYHGIMSDVFDAAAEAPATFVSGYDVDKPPEAQAPEARRPATVRNRVYNLTHGHVVDVVLQNADMLRDDVSEAHPWHLHGHDFWVLGYGDGRYDHSKDSAKLNTANPPLRNTVVLFPHGWTAIRFVADNPGVWAFHCHIEPHLHMGMGVVFAEGMEKMRELNVPMEAMMCGKTAAVMARETAPATSPPP